MLVRLSVLIPIVMLLAACNRSTPSTPTVVPPETDAQQMNQGSPKVGATENAGLTNVTLYLAGMNRKLKILGGDGPNKVKKALVELNGVNSVEDEWERDVESDEDLDLLFVTFDADKISVGQIINKIDEFDFEAVVKENE